VALVDINLSTFVFEIINFLILVWILQRFFYKPVLQVIAKRQQGIDESLQQAESERNKAENLRTDYENRLTHWEQEKKLARETLYREIETERADLLDKLYRSLDDERNKSQVLEAHRLAEKQNLNERLALQQGARFAGMLLKQAAGPELEQRLFDLLLNDLTELPQHALQMMQQDKLVLIQISSAYPLDNGKRIKLEQKLDLLVKQERQYLYEQQDELNAGFRISIGEWVLQANLQHELIGFAEIADVSV
jgi:F-type H+-transporting ATPase subunit b